MPANCPPPEPWFDIVTPGQAQEEALGLKTSIALFAADLTTEAKKHASKDSSGNLVYEGQWGLFIESFSKWRVMVEAYIEKHDEWLENFDGATISRQIELYKCELIDYRDNFEALGGKLVSPKPKFSEPPKGGVADTLGSLTNFIIVAGVAYLGYQIISSRKK